jgi:hypothetical protein
MRTIASLISLSFVLAAAGTVAADTTSLGWPQTIELLTQERSQAETCVELLKSTGDRAAIATGRVTYGAAKAQADGVVAGLTTTLIEGGKPESLPKVQANLENAGAGLKEICDAAVKAASSSGGTKGVVEEIAKAAIEPVVDAIKSAAGALWTRHVEKDALELLTIKTQLEAAKWRDFGDIAPAQ